MILLRRLLAVVWLAAVASAGTVGPPNVVLLTLDTTRADRMGFLGSRRGLTPNLDALAGHAVVFTRAYAQAPLTTASHATILTGTYPQFHQVNDFGAPLAKELPYAPAILRNHSYQTAAFVGSLILDPAAGSAPGFDRGFDSYDAGFHRRRPGEDRYQTMERRGAEVVSRATAWLRMRSGRPFFIWVHLYDAHDPYDPPPPYREQYKVNPYDGEIAYVDSAVGALLRSLRSLGIYNHTLIAVMGDHGEALGEHGEDTHGVFLYDETIRVPLLVKLPGQSSTGRRIESAVGLVDVLPTILQAAGISIPPQVQGKSLLSLMKPAPHGAGTAKEFSPDRVEYAESDYPREAFGWSPLRALRSGNYLFIDAPRKELYDESVDSGTVHNLSASSRAVLETLTAQLEEFRNQTSNSREPPKAAVDPERQEMLSALGYVASDAGPVRMPAVPSIGADPKDKIEIVNLLHQAELLQEDLKYKDAAPLLERVLTKEPDLPIGYAQLGTCFMWERKYERAVSVLSKALELRPDLAVSRYQLGSALFELGDFDRSVAQFESIVATYPEWAEARFSLATAYARTDRLPDAIREYTKVIELRPNHYGAHLLLGRALARSGDPSAGLPELTKAATLQPRSAEPHLFLADAYKQLGREDEAKHEKAEAERLGQRASQ